MCSLSTKLQNGPRAWGHAYSRSRHPGGGVGADADVRIWHWELRVRVPGFTPLFCPACGLKDSTAIFLLLHSSRMTSNCPSMTLCGRGRKVCVRVSRSCSLLAAPQLDLVLHQLTPIKLLEAFCFMVSDFDRTPKELEERLVSIS